MVQWVKNPAVLAQVTTEVQVCSPAWHSWLGIRHCHSCGIGCSCSSDSVSGLQTSICSECSHKKKEKEKKKKGSSCHGIAETILTRNHEVVGSIPGLTQWVEDPGIAMGFGVVHRLGLDLALVWL